MRYLIYARVSPKGSTWAGTETTIPDQFRAARTYILARDPGAEILETHDLLKSGATVAKRPAFRDIARDLRAGTGRWEVFVVWRLDRAFRSVADAAPFFRDLQAAGKGFISVTENLDLSTPAGRAMLGMLCVFSQFERESTSQRTKLKMVAICQAGGWPVGVAPFGYMRSAPHQNILAVHEERAGVVRALYTDYAAGTGIAELCHRYSLPRNSVWNILKNPVYKGVIRYDEKDYPGKHAPIIEAAEWDAIQASLPGHVRGPRPNTQLYPYLLAGLMRCHCGKAMSPYSTHGRHSVRYSYYQCGGTPKCHSRIPAPAVEEATLRALSAVRYGPKAIDRVVAQIQRKAAEWRAGTRPELRELEEREKAMKADLESVDRAFLSGAVTVENRDYWNDRLSGLRRDLAVIEERRKLLLAAENPASSPFAAAEIAARGLVDLGKTVERCRDNPDQLRRLLMLHVAGIQRTEEGWRAELTTGSGIDYLTRMASPRGFEPRLPG